MRHFVMWKSVGTGRRPCPHPGRHSSSLTPAYGDVLDVPGHSVMHRADADRPSATPTPHGSLRGNRWPTGLSMLVARRGVAGRRNGDRLRRGHRHEEGSDEDAVRRLDRREPAQGGRDSRVPLLPSPAVHRREARVAWTSKSIVVPGAVSLDGKYILLDPKTLAAAGLNSSPDLAYPVATESILATPAQGASVTTVQGGNTAPLPGGTPTALQGNVVTDAGTDAPAEGGSFGDGSPRAGDAGGDGGGRTSASDAGAASDAARVSRSPGARRTTPSGSPTTWTFSMGPTSTSSTRSTPPRALDGRIDQRAHRQYGAR